MRKAAILREVEIGDEKRYKLDKPSLSQLSQLAVSATLCSLLACPPTHYLIVSICTDVHLQI